MAQKKKLIKDSVKCIQDINMSNYRDVCICENELNKRICGILTP